jgi:hypothetical protein
MARHARNRQWELLEKIAKYNPVWFCIWNKRGLPELEDEIRCSLMTGLEDARWLHKHPHWFTEGPWSDERYAMPLYITEAGREALAKRQMYDMEDFEWGMVEPGWITTPAKVLP